MDRPISDYGSRSPFRTVATPRTRVQHVQETAQERIKGWMTSAGRWIADNPGISLAVALGIGVYLGWRIKRR